MPRRTLIFLAIALAVSTLLIIVVITQVAQRQQITRQPSPKERPPDVASIQSTAIKSYKEGKKTNNRVLLEQADRDFQRLLMLKPGDMDRINKLVDIKNRLQKYNEGIALVEKTLGTEDSMRYFYLGFLYDQSGNLEQARRYYTLALEKAPNNPRVHFYLARLAVFDNDTQAMRSHALKAIEFGQAQSEKYPAFGYVMLSESYHLEGDDIKALEAAQKAVSINPKCEGCYHVLGEVLLEEHREGKTSFHTENLNAAIEALEKSLALDNFFSHSYYHLGIGYWLRGERERARQTWEKALEVLPLDSNFPEWYKPTIRKELEGALSNPEQFL